MIDINIVSENKNDAIIDNPLELFLQEVLMAVTNNQYDVFDLKSPIKLKRYVFSVFVNENEIKNDILRFIADNCHHASYFKHDVEVRIMKSKNDTDLIHVILHVYTTNAEGNETDNIQQFIIGQ